MSVIVYQFQRVKFIQMMSLTFGLFTQVSGSGPLGPLVILLSFYGNRLDVSCESSANPLPSRGFTKKYQALFSLKNNEKIFINVICCSRNYGFKSE